MFWEALDIRPGVTAVIGGGGKTSLLRTLGEELSSRGASVILTTSTHIGPFPGIPCLTEPEELQAALERHSLICTGTLLPEGKLRCPGISFEALAHLADYVIVEADGSKMLPLKAHLSHEPVIPACANQTICVVGLSGLNHPIFQVAHRCDRFAQLAGVAAASPASADAIARVLNAENLADRYLLNQAELAPEAAKALRSLLQKPAVPASLRQGRIFP